MGKLEIIRDHVVEMLNSRLPADLTYHNTNHTLDVVQQSRKIALEEGIEDERILFELAVAALYHDTGFIISYRHHEERSCELARLQLPGFNINESAIINICELIMATRIPQEPKNNLQCIICDADLDYLGRDDFFETGDRLRLELIAYNFIENNLDWENRQLCFLREHQYFTEVSRQNRNPAKLRYLHQLVDQQKASQDNL